MRKRVIVDSVLKRFSLDLREKIGKTIKGIFLFGSRARGDYIKESDYDLIVLVDGNPDEVENLIDELTLEYLEKEDVVLTAFVENEKCFLQDKYEPLFINIRREGIPL